ncbi:RNA 2',3'-cyclic phosphodiesterase [bacterium]|nr:RNA 2',3'-cyclic phosphodiesterase [bacterium]
MTESASYDAAKPQSDAASGPSRRVFFALPTSEACRQALADTSQRMQKAAHFMPLRASWVSSENYHVTLHFLGRTPEPIVQELIKGLPEAVANVHRFDLDVRHIGYFPNAKQPRVLWAGVHNPPPGLKQLYDNIAELIQKQGLELQHDNFHAHVTLARFKGLKGTGMFVKQAHNMQYTNFGKSPLEAVHLMESVLHPEGARYTVIGRGALATP